MAMLEDLLKGNPLMVICVGLGAVLLAPMAGQVLRPAAKAVIKGGILAYQGVVELGEAVGDLGAEAQAELTGQHADGEEPSKPGWRQQEPKS